MRATQKLDGGWATQVQVAEPGQEPGTVVLWIMRNGAPWGPAMRPHEALALAGDLERAAVLAAKAARAAQQGAKGSAQDMAREDARRAAARAGGFFVEVPGGPWPMEL